MRTATSQRSTTARWALVHRVALAVAVVLGVVFVVWCAFVLPYDLPPVWIAFVAYALTVVALFAKPTDRRPARART